MAMQPEALPNYQSQPGSPEVADVGVQVRLPDGAAFELGKPIVLRGAFKCTSQTYRQTSGIPMSWITLIVYRCHDEPDAWLAEAQPAHNIMVSFPPEDPTRPPDPTARVGGYFNLDLAKRVEMLRSPGRYWVMAAFTDRVSDRLVFDVIDPDAKAKP